jgi:homoserine trans-succinylase
MSLYWASQTLLTVGFGDINGKSLAERIFCICWIVSAVIFYSYSIGNITSVVSSMDVTTEKLNEQLQTLQGFKKRMNMPTTLYRKIKRHLENNQVSETARNDQEQLINDLPQSLASAVLEITHG